MVEKTNKCKAKTTLPFSWPPVTGSTYTTRTTFPVLSFYLGGHSCAAKTPLPLSHPISLLWHKMYEEAAKPTVANSSLPCHILASVRLSTHPQAPKPPFVCSPINPALPKCLSVLPGCPGIHSITRLALNSEIPRPLSALSAGTKHLHHSQLH